MSGWLIALIVVVAVAGTCVIFSKKISEACNAKTPKQEGEKK